MFDSLSDLEALPDADDATVVAAIERWARAEAAAAARRLAAIAELMGRRLDDEDERALWSCDLWDCAAAEVGAALGISHRRASTQMRLAEALHQRLPRVAKLLARGDLSAKLAAVIVWRTDLVDSDAAIAMIDREIADRVARWGPLSDIALNQAIDSLVELHDPQARRRFREAARDRDVQFGKPEDATGTASMWGRLYATDAAVLDRRLQQLADSVCAADPRTAGQRRSDALGVLAAGSDRLACKCGAADCPGGGPDSRAAAVLIHVVAEQASTQAVSGEPGKPTFKAGLIVGGGVVPAPLLDELIGSGAKVSELREPSPTPEPRYRPSAKLGEFIRARDLTCRFPGCNRPAEYTDIDHTDAYPAGPTHPSNLKCLCRKHHLLKTFWTGTDGWTDRQQPDGTIEWTSPTGRVYRTHPGSRILLPHWDSTTTTLPTPTAPATATSTPGRTLMMPTRKQTRTADRKHHITNERRLNDTS